MKKAMILLLVFLFVLPHGIGLASEGDFSFDPETGTITKYTGDASEVVIPAAIQGVPVRAIGQGAFNQNSALTRVTLPESVTHINTNAFYFCENLTELTLPKNLESIDPFAFFNCTSLKELTIPAGVSFIGHNAFAFCSGLSSLTFLGECPLIEENAFEAGAEGRQITVPHEEQAAYEKALGTTCLPGADCVYVNHQVPEEQLQFDAGTGAFTGYQGTRAYALLPETVGGIPVTAISERAFFANPWLRRATLPQGIRAIGDSAFFGTPLAGISLPDGLGAIGQKAFQGTPMKAIALPGSLSELGESAFAYTSLQELRLPGGITKLPKEAFARCTDLETVYFPAALLEISEKTFQGCSQLDYLVFDGQTPPAIASDAFAECPKIADIDIATDATKAQAQAFKEAFVAAGLAADSFTVWRANPADQPPYDTKARTTFDEASGILTSFETTSNEIAMFWNHWNKEQTATLDIRGITDGLFENSSITAFFVPHSEKFEHIGKRAFAGSALQKIHLFDSVKTIDDEAFADCRQLSAITLPPGISLGKEVFKGCDGLSQLVLPADAVLSGDLGLPLDRIRVSADASEEQRAALGRALGFPWHHPLLKEGEASAFLPMPNSFVPEQESDFEFEPATGTITKYLGTSPVVVIPRAIGGVTVKEIGFLSFSNLSLYTVAQGTESDTSLNQVIIPETITQIADSAFLNCQALTRVDCFGPIERVGNRAFEDCAALEEIIFHNGVKSLDLYAFHLCKSLRQADLGQVIEALPEGAFTGCGFTGELALSIPDIGKIAYKDNAQVTALHILPTVREIWEGAFLGMTSLKEVYFEAGDPNVLGEYRYQFDETATGLKICLPESASDETLAAFITKMKQNGLPGEDMVIRKNCPSGH